MLRRYSTASAEEMRGGLAKVIDIATGATGFSLVRLHFQPITMAGSELRAATQDGEIHAGRPS